jgi:hypothetical protein
MRHTELGVAQLDSNGNYFAATEDGNVWEYNAITGLWFMPGGLTTPLEGAVGYLPTSMTADNTGNIYVAIELNSGSYTGHVWKYNGTSWSIVGNELVGAAGSPDSFIMSVAVSGNTVYCGTAGSNSNSGSVWASVNNGAWTQVAGTLVGDVSYGTGDVANLVAIGDTIYAYIASNVEPLQASVWKSVNNGAWQLIGQGYVESSGQPQKYSLGLSVVGDTVYAGTTDSSNINGSVWVSVNNESWTLLTGTLIGGESGDGQVLAVSATGNTVYASTSGTSADNYAGQVWQSVSGGAWTSVAGGAPGITNQVGVGSIVEANSSLYISSYSVSNMWEFSGSGIWQQVGAHSLDGGTGTVITSDKNNNLYVGTASGGVLNFVAVGISNVWEYVASTKTWNMLGNLSSIDNTGVSAVATESNANIIYASTYGGYNYSYATGLITPNAGDVYQYTKANSSWSLVGGGLYSIDTTGVAALVEDKSGNLYAATFGNNLYVCNVGCTSWTLVANLVDSNGYINKIAIDLSGNIYAGVSDDTVWEIASGSSLWVQLNGNGTGGVIDGPYSYITALYVGSESKLYAGTYIGNLFVYESANWVQESGNAIGGAIDGGSILALSMDKTSNLYVGTRFGNLWEFGESTGNIWVNKSYGNGSPIMGIINYSY